ncbi:MAG: YeeE/YedE family protein [Deltaproteobacteria bacterium]|nr:MAG: YeeE/YedE family protein [Deltaproteobacteria bacterium]
MKFAVAFVSGLVFALGLGIGGMLLPQKVLGFLDVLGAWDPALVGVMGGGIAVMAVAWRVFARLPRPLCESRVCVPDRNRPVDARLVLGAVIFGVGWGLGGYCPGPSIVSLVTLAPPVLVHAASMAVGVVAYHLVWRVAEAAKAASSDAAVADG